MSFNLCRSGLVSAQSDDVSYRDIKRGHWPKPRGRGQFLEVKAKAEAKNEKVPN